MARQRVERDRPKKASLLKMRLLIAVMATLCPVVCYISRQNLPFAIVSMVNEGHHEVAAASTTSSSSSSSTDLGLAISNVTASKFQDLNANKIEGDNDKTPKSTTQNPLRTTTTDADSERERFLAENTCPEPTTTDEFGKTQKLEKTHTYGPKYDWTQEEKGLLLGAFFYTYVAFQIPGARVAEKAGAKWILLAASLGSALLSFISPWAASHHVHLFSLVRLTMGLFQAALYPACFTLYSKWLPPTERSQALPILCVGAYVGSIIASGLTGYFSEHEQFGWECAFYVPGMACLAWSLVWIWFGSNEPRDHKYISIEELEYIEARTEAGATSRQSLESGLNEVGQNGSGGRRNSGQGSASSPATKDISWMKLFKSRSIWAMMAAFFASNWSFTIVLLLIPTYLSNILRVSPMENGMINSVIYVLYCIVSPLVGTGSTMMVETRACGFTRLSIRKLFQCTALFAQAVCFIAIAWLGCDRALVFAVLYVQIVFFSLVNGGEVQLPSELSPDFSGTIYAIGNCMGSSTGFIVPFVFSRIVEDPYSRTQWNLYFYLAAFVCSLGGLIFVVFGQNKMQDFSSDQPHREDPAEDEFCKFNLQTQCYKGNTFNLAHHHPHPAQQQQAVNQAPAGVSAVPSAPKNPTPASALAQKLSK